MAIPAGPGPGQISDAVRNEVISRIKKDAEPKPERAAIVPSLGA